MRAISTRVEHRGRPSHGQAPSFDILGRHAAARPSRGASLPPITLAHATPPPFAEHGTFT